MKITRVLSVAVFFCLSAIAGFPDPPQTELYALKGADSLYLDDFRAIGPAGRTPYLFAFSAAGTVPASGSRRGSCRSSIT